MTSKMISIKKELYDFLKRIKDPNESFSDLILHLVQTRKKDPLKHFGIAKDIPDEINDEFENVIIQARTENSKRAPQRFLENWDETK